MTTNGLPTRLFDLLPHRLERFGDNTLLAAKENGDWKTYSTQQVQEIIDTLSANLLSLGLSAGDYSPTGADKVAMLSANRPEWVFVDLACQQAGLILCPIYPTTNPRELEFIFNDAEVKCVFAGSEDLYEKIISVSPHVPITQTYFLL